MVEPVNAPATKHDHLQAPPSRTTQSKLSSLPPMLGHMDIHMCTHRQTNKYVRV